MRAGLAAAVLAAIRIVALMALAGCGAANDRAKAPAPNPPALNREAATSNGDAATGNEGTRVITNLSQLSSAPAPIPSINAQALVNGAAALHDGAPGPANAQALAGANLDRLYLSKEHSLVHGGGPSAPGDRVLLNAKARQFPEFSYALLGQTLIAAQELEAAKLQEHRLPDEIKPMILTAVMTPDGKLTDLSVEQHSGVGAIDRLIIDACKKGLWTMNPPQAALADDGTYRMRVEGVVRNYSYDLEGNYHYITHFGLALL